jgi:putative chitinase
MTLNLEKLKGHLPDSVIKQIPIAAERFGINTPLRLAHFLAQCAHESGNFRLVTENLNYSAQALANTWPDRFAVDSKKRPFVPNDLARRLERKPQDIGNSVYSNRMGNGGPETNDGFNFRGRGFIQLTGKDNYRDFGRLLNEDIVSRPYRVANEYPLLSAAWFFHRNNINTISDRGDSNAVVEQVTKRVNGGTIGLSDRLKYFKKYNDLLK